jgi:hypothetical protein
MVELTPELLLGIITMVCLYSVFVSVATLHVTEYLADTGTVRASNSPAVTPGLPVAHPTARQKPSARPPAMPTERLLEIVSEEEEEEAADAVASADVEIDLNTVAMVRDYTIAERASILARWDNRVDLFNASMPKIGSESVFARKIVRSILHTKRFVVGSLGSSNTAGHDTNKLEQTYPFLVADALRRMLAPMGVEVVAHNAAMSGTITVPNFMCARALLGDDPSVIFWEWAMNDAGAEQEEARWYEHLIRSGAVQFEDPAITHFVFVNHGRSRQDCGGAYAGCEQRRPEEHHFNPDLPINVLTNLYSSLNVHAMWLIDALSLVDTELKYSKEGDPDRQVPGLFTAWHPNSHGHQFIADQLVFYYLNAMSSAMDMMTRYVREPSKDPSVDELAVPLPAPKYCETALCGVDALRVAECHTSMEPRFSEGFDLLDVTDAVPDTWPKVVRESCDLELPHGPQCDQLRAYAQYGWRDYQMALRGTKADGWLRLGLPASRTRDTDILFLCEPALIWARAPHWGALRESLEFATDEARSATFTWNSTECARSTVGSSAFQWHKFFDMCTELCVPHDADELSLRVRPDAPDDLYVYLAYLVTF